VISSNAVILVIGLLLAVKRRLGPAAYCTLGAAIALDVAWRIRPTMDVLATAGILTEFAAIAICLVLLIRRARTT